jgi:hypothetical protein
LRRVRVTIAAVEKPLSTTYYERVFAALLTQHAELMHRVLLSSVACLAVPYFFRYFTKGTIFEKNLIEHKICILIFSTILYETFLILRRTQRDIIINVHWHSCKVPVTPVRF